jgi:hypothetical protein
MYNHFKFVPILLASTLSFTSCTQDETAAPPVQAAKTTANKPAPGVAVAKQESASVQVSAGDSIHGMAPKNTVMWLEIKSFDALTSAFENAVGDSLEGLDGPSDPESALAFLQLMGLPTNKLQLDQPLALALSLDLGAKEPNFTLILPMADAPDTAKNFQETSKDMKVVGLGDFIAISNSPSYRADITLAASLRDVRRDGLLGMRVQTARLVDRFEQELDLGLRAMFAQNAAGPQLNQARQAGVMALVDTLGALSKGVKDMSFRIDLVDGQLTLEGDANLRAGSRLTEFGLDDSSDLGTLLRHVDAARDELLLGTAHKGALRFLADPLVAMYDKHAVATETEAMGNEFEQLMGMVVSDSVDLALTGNLAEYKTDLAIFMEGVDSAQCVALAERFVETNLMGFQELTLMQPRKGQDEDSRFAQYDLVAQARSQMAQELEHLLGSPRVRLRFLGHGNETMITVGEGAYFQDREPTTKGPLPANLAWAFDQTNGSNPAFVSRTHAQHGYLDDLAQRVLLGTEPVSTPESSSTPSGYSPWVTSYMAFGSTEWRMGARMDLKALSQQIQKAAQLQSVASGQVR